LGNGTAKSDKTCSRAFVSGSGRRLFVTDKEAILRVGVDIGGTFTDVVFFDEDTNSVALAKARTTPVELARGVQESLAKAAVPLGSAPFLIHGSTVVVNAIIERKGARTALGTT
jgi:N-methylhydantoinase A